MFWDKEKKDRSLPDLPPMRTLPALPYKRSESSEEESDEEMPEKHALPTFPDSPNKAGFSQAAIKDAVNIAEERDTLPQFNNTPSSIQTYELEEWKPRSSPPTTEEFSSRIPKMRVSPPEMMTKEKNSDIFVKIDKFYSARRSLADVQDKLEEVSDLLTKIREMKMREEQELSTWEKDLIALKTKIEEVNSNIFEKAD